MSNLPATKQDEIDFIEGMSSYRVKAEDIHYLPTSSVADIKKFKNKLCKIFANDQKKGQNHFVAWLFASHGMLYRSQQIVLLNNYDKSTCWYEMWFAEQNLRAIAEAFPNTYHVALFACCREIYDPQKHQAFPTAEEAQKDLDDKNPKKLINVEPLIEESKQEANEIITEASRSQSAKVKKLIKKINLMLAWGCEPK